MFDDELQINEVVDTMNNMQSYTKKLANFLMASFFLISIQRFLYTINLPKIYL